MSNPLLKPDDRFRRPALTDDRGNNVFGDEQPVIAKPAGQPEVAALPTAEPAARQEYIRHADGEPSYRPRFEAVVPHRAYSLAWLSGIGFLCASCLLLAFLTTYVVSGLIFGALGFVLCLVASMQTYEELSGMSRGAVDPAGRDNVLIAYCVAMSGVVLGLGTFLWTLIMIFNGFLDLAP